MAKNEKVIPSPTTAAAGIAAGETEIIYATHYEATYANNTRVIKETQRLMAEPVEGVIAKIQGDNMRYFSIAITGPKGSPYDGGLFRLELYLPAEYPVKPPRVRFLTRIYHPNIDLAGGRICLDILQDNWSPALQIRTVLMSLQDLLSTPNPDDPFPPRPIIRIGGERIGEERVVEKNVLTAAEHWKTNEREAVERAREWTKKFASNG